MKRTIYLIIILLTFIQCTTEKPLKTYNEGIHITPNPSEVIVQKGEFILNKSTQIVTKGAEQELTSWLIDKIKHATGFSLQTTTTIPKSNYLLLDATVKEMENEQYQIDATTNEVSLKASTSTGLFYAVQSLLQLLPAQIESPTVVSSTIWSIPAVNINDKPRFSHRGVMIDVCRHFSTVQQLKKQIEVMAMLKINVLHLHLTDHQAWRIEIKKYPKLISVGAIGDQCNGKFYGPYYYTQAQIKEIVAYAKQYHIEVIPEIEFPGHCLAAIAAYPEYSCTGGPFKLRHIFGYEIECFCVGKDKTFDFFEDVLTEVSALFPSQYIHIGGDECAKKRWSECPDCKKRARKLKLTKQKEHSVEEQLQSYAIQRIEKFVADSLGKKIIGWDEILEGGLASRATVMSWRGTQGGIKAASAGHDVIMAPMVEGMYLCDGQGAHEVEPATSGRLALMEQLYHYEPIPATLEASKQKHILGTEVCLWTEWATSPTLIEYMLYPRAIASSEVNWSQKNRRNWTDFLRRLENVQVRLDLKGIHYHIPMPEGVLTRNVVFTNDSVVLKFNNTRNLPMVYTLGGKKLTARSSIIPKSLVIKESTQLQIATLLSSGKLSNIRRIQVEQQQPQSALEEPYDSHIRMQLADGLFLSDKEYSKAKFHTDSIIDSFNAYNKNKYQLEKPQLAIYEGQINLPQTGVYTFTTNCDELFIDSKRILYNPTSSRFYSNKHQIALEKGVHRFKLTFNNLVKEGLASCWQDIGFSYQLPSGEKFQKR